MSKGNLFQGMARGKVGDVVFSRLNGQQISRVRNRNPHNPRTNAQLYQRAIMASVMLAYSAGKEIFNHSFQGKAVGSECQRQFMKLNAKNLRAQIADDINSNLADSNCVGRVVAPGSTSFVPFKMQISEGSYPQNLFVVTVGSLGTPSTKLPEPETNETVADYAERNGLIAGDLYTFIIAGQAHGTAFQTPGTTTGYAAQQNWAFGWIRLKVKENLDNVETALATYGQLFDFETGGIINGTGFKGETSVTADLNVMNFSEEENASIGIIRSRLDTDLRSTSFMSSMYGAQTGIVSNYVLQAWKYASVNVGDSDLILEGGDI